MDKAYIQNFIQAGKIASQVRAFGKALIVSGASYNDVVKKINNKIVELGAKAAFPPQIALNHVAAHYLPQPNEEILFSNQVVKLDIGVCYNGAIGDCAVTVDLSGRLQSLVDAAEAALFHAEQSVKVGQPIAKIGKVIEETINKFGYKPIKNLSGHGLGAYQIHTPPQIPNYDTGQSGLIKPGMTFAIEPFATNGRGYIQEKGQATIFCVTQKRPIPTSYPKALVDKIASFEGLPFALHDLVGQGISIAMVKELLKSLIKAGLLGAYPPLVEQDKSFVAQAENSVLVDDSGQIFITTR